ncbi:hypothetical protein E9549_15175 [Blastococcus sp. MG754426]|uniref:hypothetical protein n=1 Tax=unclassified Blastococcus TaxID=2619396 RepID=UPI001EF0F233|nr:MULTISPECIES: hypothetical protein [unclassified Blastococcus]MCF6508737.1 hypothetical protein [Blastococcus sp. MG754426]MCF6513367.1 hypothetical protein [Blastococcus sp. MG754427]
MRITFQRMADRRPVETLVERDDGVVFTMRGAGGGADLPHDLVHAVVETALPLRDGVWGCVADGVVWGSMRHVSGRRPPHAAERSDRLKRERTEAVQRAETVADLVHRLSGGEEVLPGQVAASGVPRERIGAAVEAVREATRRWAALPVGERWVVEWPAGPRGPGTGGRRR